MEARLMPHAQYLAVVILVNGQARTAKAFEHQADALRWAEEQRGINAEARSLTAHLPFDVTQAENALFSRRVALTPKTGVTPLDGTPDLATLVAGCAKLRDLCPIGHSAVDEYLGE